MQEIKFIGKYVKDHWLQYLLGIAALFAVDLVNTYIPQFTGNITDHGENALKAVEGIFVVFGSVIVLGIFRIRIFLQVHDFLKFEILQRELEILIVFEEVGHILTSRLCFVGFDHHGDDLVQITDNTVVRH